MALPHFTPRQLDACVAVAELSSFGLAAKRLHLSASAVSALITELERALGFGLFERTTRKVALTRAGREFMPAAMAVRRQISLAQSMAVDIRDHAVDIVRVAAPMGLAATVLPPLIAAYERDVPRVSVRIVDTAVEWLGDRVAIGEAHLAIGPLRAVHADLIVVPLFASEWVVWTSPGDPLATLSQVALADLVGRRIVAAGRDHEDSLVPQFAAALGDATKLPEIEVVDHLTTALAVTAAGLAVTFSPRYVEGLATKFGVIPICIRDRQEPRRLALYTPRTMATPEPIRGFADLIVAKLGVEGSSDM